MKEKIIASLMAVALGMSVYGCSSVATSNKNIPAVRVNVSDTAQMELQQAIEQLSFSNVVISTLAFTKKHTLVVEKETLNGVDIDVPTVFRLFMNDRICVLENNKTKKRRVLKNTICVAL